MAKLPGTDVTNFIRGPTWVTYRVSPATHLGRPSDEVNPSYLEEEKKLFSEHPTAMRDHRRAIIGRSTKAFRMVIILHEIPILAFAYNAVVHQRG